MADYIFTGHSGDSPGVPPTWELSPAETAFNASVAVSIPNTTGNAATYQIPFETVSFDIGGNYDPLTGVYTAPTDGLYTFTTNVGMDDISVAMVQMTVNFVVGGTGPDVGVWATFRSNPYAMIDGINGIIRTNNTCLFRMDAGDTVYVRVTVFGGAGNTATVSGEGVQKTWFGGYRVAKIGV